MHLLQRSSEEAESVEGRAELVKEDRILFCKAHSAGSGGHRWTVDVIQGTWQDNDR